MSSSSLLFPAVLYRRFLRWSRRVDLSRYFTYFVIFVAVFSGVATYVVFNQSESFSSTSTNIVSLLFLDLICLLLLGIVVVKRILNLWHERKSGLAGSRMHVRMSVLFGTVAVLPAILIVIFSLVFFNYGLEFWFDSKVKTVVEKSVSVAEAYLKEHERVIAADARLMALDLSRDPAQLFGYYSQLNEQVAFYAGLRGLTEAVMFSAENEVIARAGLTYALEFENILKTDLEKAMNGDVAILTGEDKDRVRALIMVPSEKKNLFLLVGRPVDSTVLKHLEGAQGAMNEYSALEKSRTDLEIAFVFIFGGVALLLMLIAIWFGLSFATQLTNPIGALIQAAQALSQGNLSVRVEKLPDTDELSTLNEAFNHMGEQLEDQQNRLVSINKALDKRRQFTEAVLSGVSAGVVGLDNNGYVYLPNTASSQLLETDLLKYKKKLLSDFIPDLKDLLEKAKQQPGEVIEAHTTILQKGHVRTLLLRAVAQGKEENAGYVVTFDDISDLLSAQRKAAWSGVARRIAHEIKNPLTPIQLSAGRLKRLYSKKQDETTEEAFEKCLNTIVRQVGYIRNMVDEFSSFARMPTAKMEEADLSEICQECVLLQQNAHPKITFKSMIPKTLPMVCDQSQITQCITNLLQNAIEAIKARENEDSPGLIITRLVCQNKTPVIEIEDNGVGLPEAGRERLTEPYVTHKAKGTGLGLAIVKKIVEDHDGKLELNDRQGGGTCVRMVFGSTNG